MGLLPGVPSGSRLVTGTAVGVGAAVVAVGAVSVGSAAVWLSTGVVTTVTGGVARGDPSTERVQATRNKTRMRILNFI
jgi:hypothetical protein